MTTIVAVWVRVRCPYGHKLPVSVPQGTPVTFRCRQCGREFEAKAV